MLSAGLLRYRQLGLLGARQQEVFNGIGSEYLMEQTLQVCRHQRQRGVVSKDFWGVVNKVFSGASELGSRSSAAVTAGKWGTAVHRQQGLLRQY